MTATYPEWEYNGSHVVAQAATQLFKARKKPSRLSPLVFMTDPERVPNTEKVIKNLPKGAAVIYRHFGWPDRLSEAATLRQITFALGQQFLIGADAELAVKVGADGVHFRRDAALAQPKLWRQRCPDWIISMAGLKSGDYSGDLSVLDGLLVSSVYKSQSPSAGNPIGIEAFKHQVKAHPCPVFALGGINSQTASQLIGSGAAGLAGIEGLMPN